jgi:cytoskeletal protein CcmA (bactofilin family)
VRGKVKGAIVSRGPVLVGPEAEIRGDVKAPTIAIGAGAILDGNYEIGNMDRVGRWLAARPPAAQQ